MRIPRRVSLPVAAAVIAAAGVPALAGDFGSAARPDLTLPSVVPALAHTGTVVGSVTPDTTIHFSMEVAGRNDKTLKAFAEAVSDPKSATFRQFLTKAQRVATYDPAAADTATVTSTLRSLGMTVDTVTQDGRVVSAHAPASLITSAFGVQLAYVRKGNYVQRVALTEPKLPAALRPLVSDVIGLSATQAKSDLQSSTGVSSQNPVDYFNARPCSAYYGEQTATSEPKAAGKAQPWTICGYDAPQLRAAYRIPESGLDGSGVKIGIVDDYSSPTMVSDTNTYSSKHGIAGLASGQYVDNSDPAAQNTPQTTADVPNDPTCNLAITGGCVVGDLGTFPVESPQDWGGEQSLDVEMVHLMAPKATIEYYGGDQGIGLQPLEAEFSQAIAEDTAQFISDSWGAYEGDLIVTPADFQLMDTELQLGAATGIGASFSSGDDADNIEENGARYADFPSSDDMGTSVGGTTLVVGPKNSYVGETYWGTRNEPLTKDGKGWDATPVSAGASSGYPATGPGTLAGGGGGGVSDHYAEPSWQQGVVPASLTTSADSKNPVTSPGRVVPDISLVGDSTTGVIVGETQTDASGANPAYNEFRIGGTSVSSPLFAGVMALAIQKNGGKSLGFISPSMYEAYKNNPEAFRDPSLGRSLLNVRPDYTDTTNTASAKVYHLRLLGQLSSLHDLVGYDDSTGLGTPCAPAFVAAVVNPKGSGTPVAGCGLPLPGEVSTPVTKALVSHHKSLVRVGGRGPVKVGKTYTYDVLLFTVSGRGTFASPAKRTVYVYVDGKQVGKVVTKLDKKHPFQAEGFIKLSFKTAGKHYVSAKFKGATDLTASSTRGQKVVAS